jgi:geranylgeranylglycerol-phosphate geranylgeranyltransferase
MVDPMRIRRFLQLLRIHNVAGAAIGDIMGYVVFTSWHVRPFSLVLSVIVVALVAAAGYVINDVFDVEIDKVNKPNRPLPSGDVSIREAKILAMAFFVVGVIAAIPLGFYPLAVAVVTSLLLFLYAYRLKKEGFLGNLVVALTTGLSILFGGLAVSVYAFTSISLIIPVVYSFLLTLSREVIKGIEDYWGDSSNGVKTLAVRLGVRNAWNTAKGLLITTGAISPLPILFRYNPIYLVLLVGFLFYLIKTLTLPHSIEDAALGSNYLKFAAIIGILAFLIGSIPILI